MDSSDYCIYIVIALPSYCLLGVIKDDKLLVQALYLYVPLLFIPYYSEDVHLYTLKINIRNDSQLTFVLNMSNASKWHVTDSLSYYFLLSWPTASKNMNVSSFATCIFFYFQFIFLSGNQNYCMVPVKWMILITLHTSSVISMHMFLHIKLIVRTIRRRSWQTEFSGT